MPSMSTKPLEAGQSRLKLVSRQLEGPQSEKLDAGVHSESTGRAGHSVRRNLMRTAQSEKEQPTEEEGMTGGG